MAKVFLAALISVAPLSANADDKCSTVAECAQKAMEASFQAKLALQLAVPRGAVMAFNLDKCPTGWEVFKPLAGRMVVGAGTGEKLSERKVGQSGGEEAHILNIEEMPSHTHLSLSSSGINSPEHPDNTHNEFGLKDAWAETQAAGGGQAHNNMPPFYVLQYCERQ